MKNRKKNRSSSQKKLSLSLSYLAAPSVNLVSTESSGARSLTIESHLGAPAPDDRTDPSSCTWTQKVVPGSPALDAALSSQSRHSLAFDGVSCHSFICFSRDFSSWRCFSWRESEEGGAAGALEVEGAAEPKPEPLPLVLLPSLPPLSSAFRARSAPESVWRDFFVLQKGGKRKKKSSEFFFLVLYPT